MMIYLLMLSFSADYAEMADAGDFYERRAPWTTFKRRGSQPLHGASSSNPFCAPNIHILSKYHVFFRLQGIPGEL